MSVGLIDVTEPALWLDSVSEKKPLVSDKIMIDERGFYFK